MLRSLGVLAAGGCLVVGLLGCGSSAAGRGHENDLIVLDRSIGGVALRERRGDVERALGRGYVLHTSDQKPPEPRLHIEEVLYPNGLQVTYVSADATRSSRARGQVVVLLTRSPRFHTSGNVHVGSTTVELRSIEGVTCGNLLNLDCHHGGHAHNEPATFFRLSGPDGKILRIAIAYAD
jgi:hypothetical protein